MAKNKISRNILIVGEAQQSVEKAAIDKFAAVQELAEAKPIRVAKKRSVSGRINPQLSCTIAPEDEELLHALALYVSNRERKVLNISTLVRALIRLGDKYKEELKF